jgi:peptidyl-prolyl cis-trans isomerase SurA
MQLNQRLMKFTSFLLAFGCFVGTVSAQDKALSSRIKIDGVSAVVGDYVILDSDIDKTLVEMEAQGISTKEISRCQLLGK